MACRQCDDLIALPEEVGIGGDDERASSLVNKLGKAAAMSCCLLAFTIMSCWPMACAAACIS